MAEQNTQFRDLFTNGPQPEQPDATTRGPPIINHFNPGLPHRQQTLADVKKSADVRKSPDVKK